MLKMQNLLNNALKNAKINIMNSNHSSQDAKKKQHCLNNLEKIYHRCFTNVKSNMRACF